MTNLTKLIEALNKMQTEITFKQNTIWKNGIDCYNNNKKEQLPQPPQIASMFDELDEEVLKVTYYITYMDAKNNIETLLQNIKIKMFEEDSLISEEEKIKEKIREELSIYYDDVNKMTEMEINQAWEHLNN